MSNDLTPERALELFDYRPHLGDLVWRSRPRSSFPCDWSCRIWNGRFAGAQAGTLCAHGYVVISIGGKKYKAHRIIHSIEHGFVPTEVDHRGNDRANNKPSNLRPADKNQQRFNQLAGRKNRSGAKGVSWHARSGKWQVHIKAMGVAKYLGLFETVAEGAAARAEAAATLHGEFVNDGRRKVSQ